MCEEGKQFVLDEVENNLYYILVGNESIILILYILMTSKKLKKRYGDSIERAIWIH